ncbi:MAG: 1,4-alpha-glucan branching protein GlgB [Acutalibacteraceae bacterium]|nr:1,4-alpha-glucan branching protein GlgB [Acutalibacteraceae bacterium]
MADIRNLFSSEYIAKVINADSAFPGGVLGPHLTDSGFVVTVYNPHAAGITVVDKRNGQKFTAEKVDEAGLFTAFLGCDTTTPYYLEVNTGEMEDVEVVEIEKVTEEDEDGVESEKEIEVTKTVKIPKAPIQVEDPYRFPVQTSSVDAYLFGTGTLYSVSDIFGAHIKTVDGVTGTLFTVWAPNATRVSVIGDFNGWDGRMHQMNKAHNVGIFEIFIPGVGEGDLYKYEIKTCWGTLVTKTDPFGNHQQKRPETASIVADLNKFEWSDEQWLERRKNTNHDAQPMAIYELHPGSWKKKGENRDEFLSYRELAPMLADYVTEMGYTHIELMGISEHPFDGSWGYQVTGYYAPTSRFGTPEDFQYFVDYMHNRGISVILDWVPAHFPKDAHGLAKFDGTPIFEHPDARKGEHPDWGTYIFNYEKTEVRNFLIGSALFWIEKFHIDGLRVDAVASMLYLDYGKKDGEWLPNMFGGKENLEAIEFLKHLNSIVEKRGSGASIMAEESTSFGGVTYDVNKGGLGFSYKWNMGWMNDFLRYMSTDPIYRCHDHHELTFSMVYATSEKFILVLSHDEVVYGKCSMINKMPGDDWQKFANLKTAYGFMFGHPGKKLLFMGQDFAQYDEWNANKELDWYLVDFVQNNKNMQTFVKDLLHVYKSYPALYEQDFTYDGFEWMNCNDWSNSEISFVRKPSTPGEKHILVVCNFVPCPHEHIRIGVPCKGEYKLVLCSDDLKYGGTGNYYKETLVAEKSEADGKPYSVHYVIPPLSVSIFEFDYKPDTPEELEAEAKAAEEAAKKEAEAQRLAEVEKAIEDIEAAEAETEDPIELKRLANMKKLMQMKKKQGNK